MEIEGLSELRATLERIGRPDALGEAISASQTQWAEDFLGQTADLVPFSSGTLRQSARVFDSRTVGGVTETEFGYGGDASDYAVVQHERMDYEHRFGQAKFLEEPLLRDPNAYARVAAKSIAEHIMRSI